MIKTDLHQASRRFLEELNGWIGTPFEHRAAKMGQGADCLGLIKGAYEASIAPFCAHVPEYGDPELAFAHFGVSYEFLDRVFDRVCEAKIGDILVFELFRERRFHIGVLVGKGEMIHAHMRRGVELQRFSHYWKRHLVAIYRLRKSQWPQ